MMGGTQALVRAVGRWLLLVVILVTGASTARADEVAPELEGADLRTRASAALHELVLAMPAADQRRLTGVYAAFDPDASDPSAQIACDDDGDYVVVISDAMLRLASHVARASTYDERERALDTTASPPRSPSSAAVRRADARPSRVEAYASFLGESQRPARRLLPPPVGFHPPDADASGYESRLAETLAFVVVRELVLLRRGDLTCPRPTPTKERGDDVWTANERRRATEIGASVYRRISEAGQLERDHDAIASLADIGYGRSGALAVLRFFSALDALASRSVTPPAWHPSYASLHPAPRTRLAAVENMKSDASADEESAARRAQGASRSTSL